MLLQTGRLRSAQKGLTASGACNRVGRQPEADIEMSNGQSGNASRHCG